MLNKYQRILAVSCLAILIFNYMIISVYASDSRVKPINWHKWSNGAKVILDSSSENNQIKIETNTKGLEKGYYSTYVYENKNRDWSEYGELVFSVNLESKDLLKFNIIVKLEDGTSLTVVENRAIMIQDKGKDMMNLIYPIHGSIELEGDFQGTIHIPFYSLRDQNATEPHQEQGIRTISSWGITIIAAENTEQQFQINDIKLVLKENAILQNELAGITVIGDKQILKPIVGESIAQYSFGTNGLNKQVLFSLDEPIVGAVITEDGRLTLMPEIDTDTLRIRVDIDNKWRKQFNVDLVQSWSLNAKDKDGTSLAIPTSDQMSKVIDASDPFLNDNMLIMVRMIVLIGGAIIGIMYWGWRRRLQMK